MKLTNEYIKSKLLEGPLPKPSTEAHYKSQSNIEGTSFDAVFHAPQTHLLLFWGIVEQGSSYDLSLPIIGLTVSFCYFWPSALHIASMRLRNWLTHLPPLA